jgi:Uncharacterized protein conserved in bacteria
VSQFQQLLGSVAIIIVIAIALVLGGLVSNSPPLRDPPGLWVRLVTYFSSNIAQTREDHPFPELRPHRYTLSTDELYRGVREAIQALGWDPRREDQNKLKVEAVVTTPLWRFKDNVRIRIEPGPIGNIVYVYSKSRIGKGDLGANIRHVLDFYESLDRTLRKNSSR